MIAPEMSSFVLPDGSAVITKFCVLCGGPSLVTVSSYARYCDWVAGVIQNLGEALPELSAGLRETLISGSHEDCYDEAWPDE